MGIAQLQHCNRHVSQTDPRLPRRLRRLLGRGRSRGRDANSVPVHFGRQLRRLRAAEVLPHRPVGQLLQPPAQPDHRLNPRTCPKHRRWIRNTMGNNAWHNKKKKKKKKKPRTKKKKKKKKKKKS